MVILDTDHVSLLEWAENAEARRLRARLEEAGETRLVTTVVTYEEQTRGWLARIAKAKSLSQQIDAYRRLTRHLDVYRALVVLNFDERAAAEYQRLRQGKIRVGTMDLKIAAIVLAHDATLLSRNLSDFRSVPGLRIEDWSA